MHQCRPAPTTDPCKTKSLNPKVTRGICRLNPKVPGNGATAPNLQGPLRKAPTRRRLLIDRRPLHGVGSGWASSGRMLRLILLPEKPFQLLLRLAKLSRKRVQAGANAFGSEVAWAPKAYPLKGSFKGSKRVTIKGPIWVLGVLRGSWDSVTIGF